MTTLLACSSSNGRGGTLTSDANSVNSVQASESVNAVTPSGLNSSNLTARLLSRDGVLKTNSVSLAPVALGKNATDISQELAGQILADSARDKIDFEIVSDSVAPSANARFVLDLKTFKGLRGSGVGASQGAEVGFTLKLVSATSSSIFWQADFYHKDRALSDNFLALQRSAEDRAGWSDANQVLGRGLKQAFSVFSGARRQLFMAKN